ncbi:MAG TPA: hypothetical protein PLD81_06275 [Elusimicrobiales bacterium]|nr:hypothetical protein [Elusimicrobiales bacterium]HPO95603.1 hypothetical protein [Elusimicrobiales bacterium]
MSFHNNISEFLSFFIIILSFFLLRTQSIKTAIKYAAIQGVVAALGVAIINPHKFWLFSSMVVVIKGFIFPYILNSVMEKTNISDFNRKSIADSYIYLIFFLFLIISVKSVGRIPMSFANPWVFISSVLTVFSSLLFFVISKNILSQIVGYIFIENGIYMLGVSLSVEQPSIVETALLLDIFIAIFIMGIVSFHVIKNIKDEDVDALSELKDSEEN